MPPEVRAVADAVTTVFAGAFDQLAEWRSPIEQTLGTTPDMRPAALDDVVADLVLPRLMPVPEHAGVPLFVGAGVIADGEIVRGRDVHFAWWLGPLEANPVLGSTTEPTRLDLSTRGYTEYLRDFRALEWYRIPATTRDAHVTGPYVDHLCTCDYILTLTMPVHAAIDGPEAGPRMVGVVGADIAVRRLEHELLSRFLEVPEPLALVNAERRVLLSTEPTLPVGQLAAPGSPAVECAATPFSVIVEPAASVSK
ncbi:cache domain-containing protein [Agromyces neolithicus]|uniref:Cache domain-containing protein n=1 Tax=Agromyces neolithicus TaxID=269420 RepID=A0ABN2M458_9MICO